MTNPSTRIVLAVGLAATLFAAPADARRGGSFGSRGSRTYAAPRSTGLTPDYGSGVSRSMTPRPANAAPTYAPRDYAPQRRGGFGGFGGGLLTGVLAGGLIGGLLGHHWGGGGWGAGGGGGMLAVLIQIAILGGLVWLVLRLFRGNRAPAPAPPFGTQSFAAAPPPTVAPMAGSGDPDQDIGLSAGDQEAFERLLGELQDAFGHEDYARLRAITTPEVMSYLAEELSDNATHGRRNEVTATRLIDAEVSEAWREDDADFATVALRYESIDVLRDRATGAILSGDPAHPTAATELWTFVRPVGSWSAWKVAAIQEA